MSNRPTSAAPSSSRARTSRSRRPRSFARLACTGGALALLLASGSALAQGNGAFSAAPPNVLLLVDTSGSMERMPNGSLPVCTPGVAGQAPNRWGQLVQGLTGSVQPFYSCGRMVRDSAGSTAAKDQAYVTYSKAYWDPALVGPTSVEGRYDDGYALPHHRPVSGEAGASDDLYEACGVFPDHSAGLVPFGATFDPSATRIGTYPWKSGAYGFPNSDLNKCTFQQADDGQIDTAATFARFGLMTFDTDPGPGTGRYLDLAGVRPPVLPGDDPTSNLGGQWSFLYSNRDVTRNLLGYASTNSNPQFPLNGLIPGCTTPISMAVGARNEFAPPWEGPMIGFPAPQIDLKHLETHNKGVQTAILAARPYGGTPIAGMLAAAYDYMLKRNEPNSPKLDPYVLGGCRSQYVILLTDGGPNLDLRSANPAATCNLNPQGTTPSGSAPYCPFYEPKETAARLRLDVTGSMAPIETFVVGFSVGGDGNGAALNDGFPPAVATRTCAEWRATVPSAAAFETACTSPPPPAGSAAMACCDLNRIAMKGDPAGIRGAEFAESQSDLIHVFAGILGRIARGASTRAVPAFSSPVTFTNAGVTTTQSSTIVASFESDPATNGSNTSPSANIWSGNLVRRRSVCQSGTTVEQPATVANGDDFETELKNSVTSGTPAKQRYFFTAIPAQVGGAVDGDESLRPYLATDVDGVTAYNSREIVLTRSAVSSSPTFQTALNGASKKDIEDLFNVKKESCKGQSVHGKKGKLGKLESIDCARIVWGFATAARPADLGAAEADYAVRCPSANPADCKPLGAIIRSSPTVVSAPAALLRDQGYRRFAELFGTRRQTMYVASTDGLLHAFDVNYPQDSANNGVELWAFVPPQVLGELQSNYPGGQRTLLDGSPVVKDVVFSRTSGQVGQEDRWHTALVAGVGRRGYYALDVTANGQLNDTSSFQAVTDGSQTTLTTKTRTSAGPHFLWQISSTQANGSGEKGKKLGHKNKKNDDLYGIFGDKTGTPAITTVTIGTTEVGVAILPGGIDESPPNTVTCPRRTSPLYNFVALKDQIMRPRPTVRGWANNCNEAVGGRSVTIVRLDNGQIIRHFARNLAGDKDAPKRLIDKGVVTNSPFDAPMTGTPVVFPSEVGSVAQKAFIGDADGTLYRLDLSSTNPAQWKAELFLDTRGAGFLATDFVGDKPIAVPPVVSLSDNGNLVIGVANGDQEDFGAKPATDSNLIWSVTEIPGNAPGVPSRPSLNWFMQFRNGERVTGPMAVFDKTLYFATYAVATSGTACTVGEAHLFGRDYVSPYNTGNLGLGGDYRSPAGSSFTVNGTALIPGVSIRATQACATDQTTNDYFGGTRIGAKLTTPTSYSLFANVSASGGTNGNKVQQINRPLALPRTRTVIDSWAAIVE